MYVAPWNVSSETSLVGILWPGVEMDRGGAGPGFRMMSLGGASGHQTINRGILNLSVFRSSQARVFIHKETGFPTCVSFVQ